AKLHPARATVCTLPTSSQRKFNALACTPSLVGGFVGNRINAGLARVIFEVERLLEEHRKGYVIENFA
uniref:Uncharacterized protein n=1 Tax=Anopheles atroparvus TaxID=41427 RepID=A0AAG5CZ18_ANOAO